MERLMMTMNSIIEELRTPPVGYASMAWGDMEYTDWIDESMSWKTSCYVGDWSWLPDLLLKGPDAQKLLSDISVNSFAKFDVEKSKHIIQCNNDGKIIAQGVCMRTAADEFHLQWTPAWWTDYKLRTGGYNAMGKFVNTTNYQGFHPTGTYTYSAPRPRGRTITGLDVLRTKYALGIYGKVFFIGRGRRCSHKILNTLFHRVREVTKALKSSFAFIQRGCVFRLINGFSYC